MGFSAVKSRQTNYYYFLRIIQYNSGIKWCLFIFSFTILYLISSDKIISYYVGSIIDITDHFSLINIDKVHLRCFIYITNIDSVYY